MIHRGLIAPFDNLIPFMTSLTRQMRVYKDRPRLSGPNEFGLWNVRIKKHGLTRSERQGTVVT